jgi:hypothetical protein
MELGYRQPKWPWWTRIRSKSLMEKKPYQAPSIVVLGSLSELTLTRKKFGQPNDGIFLVLEGGEEKSLTNFS